jgi:two-component system sensor histidine kinase TctE
MAESGVFRRWRQSMPTFTAWWRRRKPRRIYSLRGRLLLWMLLPLLLVLSCSGVIAYYQAVYYAYSEYDQTLYDHVHSLSQLVEKHGKRVSLNMPRQAKRMFLWDDFDTTYYQISTANRVVAGEKNFPMPQGRILKYYDTLIFDGEFKGTPVRVAILVADHPELGQAVQVKVAQTQHRREKLTRKILLSVLAPQLALIVIVILVVSLGVNRSLRPLSAMSRALDAQNHQRIAPIPGTGVPREVLPLVRAINDLLTRLDEALASQRKFVANAAHQLRTPLTAIRLNLDRLLSSAPGREQQEAEAHLRASVERTIRLSRQLLMLARAEPEGLRQTPLALLDLVELAREEGMEWVPPALAVDVELSLEAPDQPVWIQAHATLLREALSNLIDNALKYGSRPGRIVIGVSAVPTPGLWVQDDGPGIDPDVGDKVFERFFRNDEGGDGAGLGLAIVKEIAVLHAARIELGPGLEERGLRVRLNFPLPEERIVPAAHHDRL